MDKKLLLLKRMCNRRTDEVRKIHYQALNYGFMDLISYIGMEEDAYIEFIKNMAREGYIKYDMNGYCDIKKSIIKIDSLGFSYLADHDKEIKMGFHE